MIHLKFAIVDPWAFSTYILTGTKFSHAFVRREEGLLFVILGEFPLPDANHK